MDYLANLTSKLASLPGIGKKTASRLSYVILTWEEEKAYALAEAIVSARANVKYCSVCHNISQNDPCEICSDVKRDKSVICVVSEPKDITAIERTKEFKGLYHVLGGVISPISGTGPNDIAIPSLMARLGPDITEVILATNLSVEGETTASYIARLIKPFGIKVTRIARGIPTGAELEYTDEATLAGALNARREMFS